MAEGEEAGVATETVTVLEKKEEEGGADLQPWEQHSAVISIPRFDYNAPSSLLHNSYSGFLITCPLKREKSATKEAISILEKFIGGNSFLEKTDTDEGAKRRKICDVDGKSEVVPQSEGVFSGSPFHKLNLKGTHSVVPNDSSLPLSSYLQKLLAGELSEDAGLYSEKNEDLIGQKPTLSLVKLTKSGLLLFLFPKDSSLDPVGIVSSVHQSLDCGAIGRPNWCIRILPIQATCVVDEKELGSIVSCLVRAYVNNKEFNSSTPLKYAVGYNRRGIEQAEKKPAENSPSDPQDSALLNREKCFDVVAAAIKGVISDSAVNLRSPEVCILIECLPLSGVPNSSVVAAVSLVPHSLVTTKPRLSIKAMVSDPKPSSGAKSKG